jgi:hypothetical protein
MWDPTTRGIHKTRDIIWLKRMYFPKVLLNPPEDGDDIQVSITVQRSSIEAGERIPNIDSDEDEEVDTSHVESVHEEEADNIDDDQEEEHQGSKTRSGRSVKMPERLIAEMNVAANDYEIQLTPAEENYYAAMKELGEFGLIGAGIGGGFINTSELHVMKYDEAMTKPDKSKWDSALIKEHDRFTDHTAFQEVKRNEVPKDTKIMSSTWAMKKKASGIYRARLNAGGFEQVDGEHYDKTQISSPVVNEITVRMVLTLICMARWCAMLLDVKGAFLCGNGEKIYMEIPQGFERFYGKNSVLLLLKTIYGLKQAALAFWRELLKAFRHMEYGRSKADPCLYFRWTAFGLILWLSWVDDCLVGGKDEGVKKAKAHMMDLFDCDDVGELKEYVGCKVDYDRNAGTMKLTQPVMIQSFQDEFELPEGKSSNTQAIPGTVMSEGEVINQVDDKIQSTYRSGIGKLLHDEVD